jgi:hypothetical protein
MPQISHEGDKIIIAQVDTPGTQFRKFLDDANGIRDRSDEIAEGIAFSVADCHSPKLNLSPFFACVLVAGALLCKGWWEGCH